MQLVGELIDSALNDEISFDRFSESVQELGVESIAFDMLKRRHTFYGSNGLAFDHPLKSDHPPFDIVSSFKREAVITAIGAFDRQEISASQFHVALAAAGVSFARCYFKGRQAIYFGRQGDFYLEQW